jgi:hypothetical protein
MGLASPSSGIPHSSITNPSSSSLICSPTTKAASPVETSPNNTLLGERPLAQFTPLINPRQTRDGGVLLQERATCPVEIAIPPSQSTRPNNLLGGSICRHSDRERPALHGRPGQHVCGTRDHMLRRATAADTTATTLPRRLTSRSEYVTIALLDSCRFRSIGAIGERWMG